MPRTRMLEWLALAGLLVCVSGCAQIRAAHDLSLKRLTESNVEQATFEEKIPDAPPDPKDPNRLKLAYARWMEEKGNTAEARSHYSAVAEAEPKNVDAILGVARIDLLTGNTAAAEQAFLKAVKIAPESAAAHYELGVYYANQNRWTAAVAELHKATLADPTNSRSRFQLAVAMTHTGDVDEALSHFGRVVSDAEAHYNVGVILQEERNLVEAEKHLQIALNKKPDFKEAEKWLQVIHRRESAQSVAAAPVGAQSPREQASVIQPASANREFSAAQREQLLNQQPLN